MSMLEQLNNAKHRVKAAFKADHIKKKTSGMKSLANFGNLQFGKLVDTSHDQDSMVKTKNAGIFMRHNKINHGLKNKLGQGDSIKFGVKNQKINHKVQSLANMIESSASESSGDNECLD